MMILSIVTFLLCLVGSIVRGLDHAEITLSQSGMVNVKIPADGYYRVAIHLNINQDLSGVAAGQVNHDMTTPHNGFFEWQTSVQAHAGDKVHYWLWGEKNGMGETVTDLSATLSSLHTTVPTQSPSSTQSPSNTQSPSTISPVVTNAPVTSAPAGSENPKTVPTANTGMTGHVTQAPSGNVTGGSQTSQVVSGVSTSSGTGTGVNTCGSGAMKGHATQCQSYPCLIFEDEFNTLDFSTWQHEITAGGGGNWEFEYYTNNRSNSYVKDGTLYIKPTLTSDKYGESFLTSGTLDLWGGSPADLCTGNMFWGCSRQGSGAHPVNPIQSARLRSSRGFTMKYGKVEVEAKMPKGDWIWPAIWMLPAWNAYGQWPASGEIDIVESRGNPNYHDDKGVSQGVDSMGSTLHFGPGFGFDPFEKAHGEKHLTSGTFADTFHKFAVEWDETMIRFTVNGEEILKTVPPAGGFWELGEFDKTAPGMDNPWRGASKMAPFDQEFYLLMNVAVGGTGFFPDTFTNAPSAKPWTDKSEFTSRDFWNARSQWYPTWNPNTNNGEDAAMKVNYVKVWKMKP